MGTRADFYKVAAENHVEVLRYPMPIIGSMSTEVNGRVISGWTTPNPAPMQKSRHASGMSSAIACMADFILWPLRLIL